MMTFHIDAPPTRAEVVTDGSPGKKPGYIVRAVDKIDAMTLVREYRTGAQWAVDAAADRLEVIR